MIVKNIAFENFDEQEVVETHYFHLSKSDIFELELHPADGIKLTDKLNSLANHPDPDKIDYAKIDTTLRWFIGKSYGLRVEGNASKFEKSEEIANDFIGSLAFEALYDELTSDPEKIVEFVYGLIPKKMASDPEFQKALEAVKAQNINLPPDPNGLDKDGTWPRSNVVPSIVVEETGVDDSDAWPTDNGPQPPDAASGLKFPRTTEDGSLVPWAFRDPTPTEIREMTRVQMAEAYQRKSSDWKPFQFKTS
jgi:hypothetical protein